MAQGSSQKLTDDLLKEALKQEIESVNCPPPGPAWHRIKTRLQKEQNSKSNIAGLWRRYAMAAAALLIIIVSSYAFVGDGYLFYPSIEKYDSFEASDESIMLETVNDEDLQYGRSADISEHESGLFLGLARTDPAPRDWPSLLLNGNLFLGEAFLLEKDKYIYLGAEYHGLDSIVLLMKSVENEEELSDMIHNLSDFLFLPVSSLDYSDESISFELNSIVGLAWEKDGDNFALLVISGFINIEDLRLITREVSN